MLKRDLWSKAILLMFVFALLNGTVSIVSSGFVGLRSCYGEPGCEGDFDADRDVDGSDLAEFAADFGRTNCFEDPPCEGDFDEDGDVDGSDLAVFAADFGRTDCPEPIPPDPVEVAPEIDPTVATQLGAATEFLYAGDNPIQSGVAPGTIEENRVAVLRGKVLDQENTPLSGVTITILDHPEYGHTLSREDGMFDMAVNGGGVLTVSYIKNGHLPAQRTINTPWQNFIILPDVVVMQLDPVVTTVDLNSQDPFQVARGSVSSDDDGDRQATLLFPEATTAELVFPDGSTAPITSMNVRATEFTVGENGHAAMPAELPPTSAYTYAVELSVDEAIAAGAQSVTFNQEIPFYVENFLSFPTGIQVPTAYYDQGQAAWIPITDGRVVEILDIVGGLAELDTNGDGSADNGALLGVTDAERQEIASLYTPGQSLWRVMLEHFTSIDCNFPVLPIAGARRADRSRPDRYSPAEEPSIQGSWGTIDIENQVFRESLLPAGSPFRLNYASDRVSGRTDSHTLEIELSGPSIPPDLKQITLEVLVAGNVYKEIFPAAPDQTYTFVWDGKNIYEQNVYGTHEAFVKIGYVYDGYIALTPPVDQSFGLTTGELIPGDIPARRDVTLWQRHEVALTIPIEWYIKEQGIGGWTFSSHHAYDPTGRVLHLGTGRSVFSESSSSVVKNLAGTGNYGYSAFSGPAINSDLADVLDIAVDSEGNIYIAQNWDHVSKIGTDGMISRVAGGYDCGPSGDGGPAIDAELCFSWPFGIDVGPDGSLYIVDNGNCRIRRVGTDGIINTIVGFVDDGWGSCFEVLGDGGPATSASVDYPTYITVAQDGSFYFVDEEGGRIRRVGTDGIITTIAGNGTRGYSGDGGPAQDAVFDDIHGIDIGPDGSLYIADNGNHLIRRIGPDGIITTVVGNGMDIGSYSGGYSGDGGPATDAQLSRPTDVTVARDGTLYIADEGNDCIRRVGTDNIITTAAGNGNSDYAVEGSYATASPVSALSLAMAPDDSIVFSDYYLKVSKLKPVLPDAVQTQIVIPSPSGNELYIFDPVGRHLETKHALTGETLLTFGYDPGGRLVTLTDADNNVTTISRDTNGVPTSITSPFGQTTDMSLDDNGYLNSMTNPAGETIGLQYTADGLLVSITDPEDNTYDFEYDAKGRLTRANNPGTGFSVLNRTEITDGHEVSLTTAEGRASTYRVEYPPSGNRIRTVIPPNGLVTKAVINTDGSYKTTLPDGTVIDVILESDPRFGMQTPILASHKRTAPSGLETNKTLERTVLLSDPSDILSVTSITDTLTVNGRTFTTVYDGDTRTFTTTSPDGRKSTLQIDAKGRITAGQIEDLAPSEFTYNDKGLLTSMVQGTEAEARTSNYGYDANGRLFTSTDAANRSTLFQYDPANRVTGLNLPGTLNLIYDYDARGNLTSVTPPAGATHIFAHNKLDLLATYTAPDIGLPSEQTAYAYNKDRQLTTITRPDNLQIIYTYDAAGRLSTVTLPSDNTNWTYDADGRLQTVSSANGVSMNFGYDGSLLTSQSWTGPVSGTVGYDFNSDLQITSIAVNGSYVPYTYDNDGWLATAGALSIERQNLSNHLVSGTSLDQLSHTFGYNGFGEMVSLHTDCLSTEIYDCQYTRNKLGRIIQKGETIGGSQTTYDYVYDDAGRLIEVKENDLPVYSFTYDGNGNRLTSGSTAATYDGQDRLITYGTASYTYTANGELDQKTDTGATTTYQYDVLGNLLSVTLPDNTLIEYVVGGTGRRIAKRKDGSVVQKFLYAGHLTPIAELDAADHLVSRFVYGVRSGTPEYMVKGGETYRIITDHLGSVRLVVDAQDGSIAQRMDYDVFGNVLSDTSPGFQPFGFAGGIYDTDTGLVRFGVRDYDSQTGRWTAKDPLQFEGSPLNFYAYVGNDPVNFVDPLGLGPASTGSRPAPSGASSLPAGSRPAPAINHGSLSEDEYKKKVQAIGITGSGGLIFGMSIDIAYAWDETGNSGILVNVGGGLHFGGNVGVGFIQSDYYGADDIWELTGPGAEIGGSVGPFGQAASVPADINMLLAKDDGYVAHNQTVSASAGTPDFHEYGGVSVVFNLNNNERDLFGVPK